MAVKKADSASPAPDAPAQGAPAPEVKVSPFAAIIAKKKESTKKFTVHFENLIEAVNTGYDCKIAISVSSLDWTERRIFLSCQAFFYASLCLMLAVSLLPIVHHA